MEDLIIVTLGILSIPILAFLSVVGGKKCECPA